MRVAFRQRGVPGKSWVRELARVPVAGECVELPGDWPWYRVAEVWWLVAKEDDLDPAAAMVVVDFEGGGPEE